ncbi:methyl-accepting chemotaxis protein [Actinoplanes campanulatus]|uniref:Methyl-accepting chemotaxis protein n=1 Tax=Actinoplanes campanulatus TaxID=113559 RepID=A0A7W5AGR4_9ACTN|nr:methyl-accepting chemotaxis protein [Actinoplanes campanulatus]MBB3095928.1 methyl-accepting chemotaxis protein [Actinoplanes campanulatus]GGN12482.1 chemotaxis protein [Actinoplanes campanulatus]GID36977.1 chemotaxis protein [Actinoplanes campanulatus]
MALRMTVGRKLAALAATGAVVATAISVTTFVNVATIESANDLRRELNVANASVIDLDKLQTEATQAQRDAILVTAPAMKKVVSSKWATTQQDIDTDWNTIAALDLPADVRTRLDALKTDYTDFIQGIDAGLDQLAAGKSLAFARTTLLAGEKDAAAIEKEIDETRTLLDAKVLEARAGSDEANRDLKTQALISLGVGLVALAVIAVLITRSITGPLRLMVDALDRVAGRDLTTTVAVKNHDEIGEMAAGLGRAVQAMREAISTVGETSRALTGAADELSAVSAQLGDNADETSVQAGAVSVAAEQVSTNVDTMSAATEEMTASILEISRSASTAAEVATGAVNTAREAAETVRRLDQASGEIGSILMVIKTIAEQTNLLALNATIEAARAGEMGKGFAVVASEVKDLAQETARATEDISQKTTAIQASTGEVTEAIARIAGVVDHVNELQTTIAAAVEQQSATASEISRNVGQVAAGSNEIAQNITGVASAAQSTSQGAGTTRQSAAGLSGMAGRVDELLRTFKY